MNDNSQNATAANSFYVRFSELENRFDPHFHQPKYKILQESLLANHAKNLGSLINFSNEVWDQKEYFDTTFPYIEISEIDTETGQIRNVNQVLKVDAPNRAKKIVRERDILLSTTRPKRGAIALLEKRHDFHIASTGFSILREIKPDVSVSKDFLFVMLCQNFCLEQFAQRSSGGNYPAITEEELRKVLIPIRSLDQQREFVAVFKQAIKHKDQKEAKAQSLLNSIDDYLLEELGIELPEKDNSLESRIFTTTFQKVSGKRFDPFYNQVFFEELNEAINNASFSNRPLKSLCYSVRGVTYSSGDEMHDKKGIKILRANNIDLRTNELDLNEIRYLRKDFPISFERKLRRNDILMSAASGSKEHVGKVAFIEEYIDYYFGGFMSVLRVNNNQVMPKYLFLYLQSRLFREMLYRILGGTNINNLYFQTIANFSIPLPSKKEQKKIVYKIETIRNKALELEKEARQEVEKARKQIEEIILKDQREEEMRAV